MNFHTVVQTFLDRFPDGFTDLDYLRQERGPKLDLSRLLNESAPLEEVANGLDHSHRLLPVFEQSSGLLLHWRESVAVQTLLHDRNTASQFTQNVARLARGSLDALPVLDELLKPHHVTKWPVVTFLPFLWDASKPNMFLRYTPTVRFAEQIGYHDFHYESALNERTYSSLADLCQTIEQDELIRRLRPEDYIDLQGLIWTTSRVREDASTLPRQRRLAERSAPTASQPRPATAISPLASAQPPRLDSDASQPEPADENPIHRILQPEEEAPDMPNDTERRLELLEKDLENERRSREYERESRDRLHESIRAYFDASQKVSDSHLQTVDALTTSIRDRLTSIESRLNSLPALVIGTVTVAVTIAIAILGYMVSQQEVRLVPLQPVQVVAPQSQPSYQTEPRIPAPLDTSPDDLPPLDDSE